MQHEDEQWDLKNEKHSGNVKLMNGIKFNLFRDLLAFLTKIPPPPMPPAEAISSAIPIAKAAKKLSKERVVRSTPTTSSSNGKVSFHGPHIRSKSN